MTSEEEIKDLRTIIFAQDQTITELQKRFLKEQDSNIRTANRCLSLEKSYEEALEELVYKEEYFRLYESKFVKFCTKTVMKFKKLKGKVKSYVLRYSRSGRRNITKS